LARFSNSNSFSSSGVFIFLRSFSSRSSRLFDLSQIAHQQIELDILNVF